MSLFSVPLPLIILLLVSIHGTCLAASSNPCAASSSCGNITVNYPFALSDLHSSTTNYSYCGYPGLQVYCYNNKIPILFLGSNNYTITDISYTTKTISLVDTDILLQSFSTSTPKIDHNVSLTSNIWLEYTNLVINITFFLNCPKFVMSFSNSSFTPANSKPRKYSYVFPTAEIPDQYSSDWAKICEEVVVAPALGPSINSQVLNLSSIYNTVLLKGFQLEWRDESGSEYCTQCEKRGGQCGYNVTSNLSYNLTCSLSGTYNFTLLVLPFICCIERLILACVAKNYAI